MPIETKNWNEMDLILILTWKPFQVCDISYALTKEILLEARSVSEFSGKKQVDRSDIDFALQVFS